MGQSLVHTMITVTIITGTDDDRSPDTQYPVALLATGEDYESVKSAFVVLEPEMKDIKTRGFPCVMVPLPLRIY